MSRLPPAPSNRSPIQLFSLPTLLMKRRVGPLAVADDDVDVAVVVDVTERRARLTSTSLNASPARADTSSNRPFPRLRYSWFEHLQRERILGARLRLDHRYAAVEREEVEPRVVVVVEPGRAKAGLGQARRHRAPTRALRPRTRPLPSLIEDVHLREPVGDEQILVAVVVEVAGIDAHAGFRVAGAVDARRRRGTPMSLKVPFFWFIQSWLASPSLPT